MTFRWDFDFDTYPSDQVVLEYMATCQDIELIGTLSRDSVAICFSPDEGQLPEPFKSKYNYAIHYGEYPSDEELMEWMKR